MAAKFQHGLQNITEQDRPIEGDGTELEIQSNKIAFNWF